MMNSSIISIFQRNLLSRSYCYKAVKRPDFSKLERKFKLKEDVETDKKSRVSLANSLKARILATGPVTVADYMKEVLTNPISGYYMNRDVFGGKGDFITSPEISQIFGELVAIWTINEWSKLGSQKPFQLVEFGPGRGTLARDVLKVFSKFNLTSSMSFHMVEVSDFLSNLQAQKFCFSHEEVEGEPYYRRGKTATGTDVFWYKQFEDVPDEFSIYLAHEFFDVLPIHKLQLVDNVWKEILIGYNLNKMEEGEGRFQFVLSKGKTPVSQMFVPLEGDKRETLEYSLESERIVHMLSRRIENNGGIALIMDYGHFGDKSDTFRAFKEHKLHNPLDEPGSADLTADVDFYYLKHAAEKAADVICYGPVEQGSFIKKMEGDARLEMLLQHALPENKEAIESGYKMLTDPSQMGRRFKFFSIFPGTVKDHLAKYPIAGFN